MVFRICFERCATIAADAFSTLFSLLFFLIFKSIRFEKGVAMARHKKSFVLFLVLCSFLSVLASRPSFGEGLTVRRIRFAAVPKTNAPPVLDGNLEDPCWQAAAELEPFVLTAGKSGNPALHPTRCRLVYDDTHLYAAFRCAEPNPAAIKAANKQSDSEDIEYDDRVELFLDTNHDHRFYYELAVNPAGAQFDQTCYNRLSGSKTCDMNPAWNCFWRAKTRVGDGEWTAEIAVDVTSFGLEGLEDGTTWGFNAARVRQPDVVKGDELFQKGPTGPAEYSAWSPTQDFIRETISNFHSPIEFGDLVLGTPGFRVKEIRMRSALYAYGPIGNPSLFGWNPLELVVETDGGKSVASEIRTAVEPATQEKWQSSQKAMLVSGQTVQTAYWIPEAQENKIVLQVVDAGTGKQRYRTSYVDTAPPFIEFNLEALYSRALSGSVPVTFRLLADDATRSACKLELAFCDSRMGTTVERVPLEDLTGAAVHNSVFNTQALRVLPGGNYFIHCTLIRKATGKVIAEFRQNLTKFASDLPTDFSAVQRDYSYGGITDQAIRIRFPFPAEFVFWRSGSYIPWWDCDQAAYTNEFVECWGAGNQGCNEPMQDRERRYSRVELLESSPARAVVHWRYALSDPHYRIYRNEWVDEYYVLYPDGVGVRQVNLWPNSSTRHEMYEALLAKPPGVQTEQLFEEAFATLSTLGGESRSNKEFNANKDLYKSFLGKADDFIIEIHFKDRLHPFTAFSFRPDLLPNVTRDHVTVCSRIAGTADRRGHWPASRYQIDGYNTIGLDVPHHGNIGNIQSEVDGGKQPNTWTFLIGVQEKGSGKAVRFASSWLYPGDAVSLDRGVSSGGFDVSQRAYTFRADPSVDGFRARLEKAKQDILNPVFIIENPGRSLGAVRVGGRALEKSAYAEAKDRNGKTVVCIHGSVRNGQTIGFEFN